MRTSAPLLALLLIAIVPPSGAKVFSLSGADWLIKDNPGQGGTPICSDWLAARVPGNIQADLEAARMLKPLWYGAGDARLYEVPKRAWYYRKDFVLPADYVGTRSRLILDGVDNVCEVWLNGHRLGGNGSMFTRFEFEVGDKLRVGEMNRLEVRLEGIPDEVIPYVEKSDGTSLGSDAKWRFTNGMQKSMDVLKQMKSGTNFGYDWGVNIWTLGIWKDVRLESSGPAVVQHVKIETPLRDKYTMATVALTVAIDSSIQGAAILKLRVTGHNAKLESEQRVMLAEGANALQARFDLERPALWWPNGHGAQNLYTLEATIVDSSGRESHSWRSRFGIREVRWEPTAGAPGGYPEKYLAVVNGRPVRMIGSNLIPPDLLFSRIPGRAAHLLHLARDGGFNTLRLWGGGVLFEPEFYGLADELGLMLMFEIFMANIDPRPEPELLKNLDETLPNIIRQVWNHPSIIEYTGGNEMNYGRDGNFAVIERIRKIFDEVDPSRLFRDNDPANGSTHGSWNYPIDPSNHGDPVQVYTAWNGLEPLLAGDQAPVAAFPTKPGFSRGPFYIKGKAPGEWKQSMRYGEFGYQTPAHLEVWHRDIPPASQWPVKKEDPVLIRKNVAHAIAVFDDDTWLEKPVIDRLFGQAPDLEYLLQAGQYVGAEGLRYAIDAIRRRGAATGAMLTWDFNEPWTNGAGSYLVDYDGRPLMNYAFARQAFGPLSLSLRHESALYELSQGIRTTLYLSSDAAVPAENLTWSWLTRDRRGEVIASGQGRVTINPLEVRKLADIAVHLPERTIFGPCLVELRLTDGSGQIIDERVHVFGLNGVRAPLRGLLDQSMLDPDDDPKALGPLLARSDQPGSSRRPQPEAARPLKRTSLQATMVPSRFEGADEILEITVTNTGAMTALFLEPQPLLNYRTDLRINRLFVSIPPGETRNIEVRAPRDAKDGLTLGQTGWRLTSWNADPILLESSPDILLSVGRADRMSREFIAAESTQAARAKSVQLTGRRPDAACIPHLLAEGRVVEFAFQAGPSVAGQPALLRLHSADQSVVGARLGVEVNGRFFQAQIPAGYGFQESEPAHLARAQCTEIAIPVGLLKAGENLLRVRVQGSGWLTWDALDLRAISR